MVSPRNPEKRALRGGEGEGRREERCASNGIRGVSVAGIPY
jgi:hypothetical protein